MDKLIYFKAFSDETRIRLVNVLLRHQLKVSELVSIFEMGQSRISRHLKILADAGLVKSWKDGVWGLYYIPEDGPPRDFIEAIRYILEEEPGFRNDIERADKAVALRKSRTRSFFDDVAGRWDRLKLEILGDFNITEAILDGTGQYDVGVDLGCGTGDLLAAMKSHAGKLIGVDSSPRMLEEARKRFNNGNGTDIRLGELEHLPIGDSEADFVVISLVLQYLDHPEKAIAEVGRILRPGGHFVIADFQSHRNSDLREKYGARRLGFKTSEIENWLSEHGFKVEKIDTHPLGKDLTLAVYRSEKN